jgi:hypothetical protein
MQLDLLANAATAVGLKSAGIGANSSSVADRQTRSSKSGLELSSSPIPVVEPESGSRMMVVGRVHMPKSRAMWQAVRTCDQEAASIGKRGNSKDP